MTTPELATPNMTLLRRAVRWAKAEAEKPKEETAWNQGEWRRPSEHNCHTTFCIAGFVAESAGGTWASEDPNSYWFDSLVAEPEDDRFMREAKPDGTEVVSVAYRARRLLGLTHEEASDLFSPYGRSIDRLMVYAKVIAKRAGKRLL